MLLKLGIIFICLFGLCSKARNLVCPSENGNSSKICLKDFEVCCDNECLSLNSTCKGFNDEKIWIWCVFSIASLTDLGQIFIVIYYRKVFYYRMTWNEENEGFTHRHFIKYVEQFIDYISCGMLGRKKLRGQNLNLIIDTKRLSLWCSMVFSLALGFSQRLLDLQCV